MQANYGLGATSGPSQSFNGTRQMVDFPINFPYNILAIGQEVDTRSRIMRGKLWSEEAQYADYEAAHSPTCCAISQQDGEKA